MGEEEPQLPSAKDYIATKKARLRVGYKPSLAVVTWGDHRERKKWKSKADLAGSKKGAKERRGEAPNRRLAKRKKEEEGRDSAFRHRSYCLCVRKKRGGRERRRGKKAPEEREQTNEPGEPPKKTQEGKKPQSLFHASKNRVEPHRSWGWRLAVQAALSGGSQRKKTRRLCATAPERTRVPPHRGRTGKPLYILSDRERGKGGRLSTQGW